MISLSEICCTQDLSLLSTSGLSCRYSCCDIRLVFLCLNKHVMFRQTQMRTCAPSALNSLSLLFSELPPLSAAARTCGL